MLIGLFHILLSVFFYVIIFRDTAADMEASGENKVNVLFP